MSIEVTIKKKNMLPNNFLKKSKSKKILLFNEHWSCTITLLLYNVVATRFYIQSPFNTSVFLDLSLIKNYYLLKTPFNFNKFNLTNKKYARIYNETIKSFNTNLDRSLCREHSNVHHHSISTDLRKKRRELLARALISLGADVAVGASDT